MCRSSEIQSELMITCQAFVRVSQATSERRGRYVSHPILSEMRKIARESCSSWKDCSSYASELSFGRSLCVFSRVESIDELCKPM